MTARIGKQRRVQRAFDHAGLGRRCQFRPRQIGLEELVGDDEPTALMAVEQVMPAGEPEVLHAAGTTFHTLTWLHTIMAGGGNGVGMLSTTCSKWPADPLSG